MIETTAPAARDGGGRRAIWPPRQLPRWGFRLLVAVSCLLSVAPFYWLFVTSVQRRNMIYVYPPPVIPAAVSLQNYLDIFNERPIGTWLWNTTLVSVATTLAAMAISVFAGYAISRYRSRGLTLLGFLVLVAQMLPGTLIIIPLYVIFASAGLLKLPLLAMIVAFTTFSLPFSIWMLKGFFDTIPFELEESAMIDGCTRFGTLFRIVLPLARPGIAATSLFSFILAWDEYLFARVLATDQSTWVSSVGIASFYGEHTVYYDQVAALGVLMTLPILAIFVILQRHIVTGLTAGGLKG